MQRPVEFTQFTSSAFTTLLHSHAICISMDGKGCWRDNVFIERVWRSIKDEKVYLHPYETVSATREGIGRYGHCYNPTTALEPLRPNARRGVLRSAVAHSDMAA